jgi:hypothetical protein
VQGEDVVTKLSPWSVADTVARLLAVAAARELKVFAIIDHSGEAANVGMHLRDTTLQDDGISGNLGLQGTVGTQTRTALLDEIIPPPGFVLLGRDGDPFDMLSPPMRAVWHQLGDRSAHFGPDGLTDSQGKYAAWFEQLNASVVVIRPDFQVFGGVLDPSTTDGLVGNLVERVLAHSGPGTPTARRPEASAAKD